MKNRTNRTLTLAALVFTIVASAQSVRANLLVDPGFEVNQLDTAYNVLNFFSTYQGIWGVEAATISGVDNGVTPFQGVQMLRMVDDGLTATQGFQVTDVSSYATLIDSGGATVNLSALFNVDKAVPAAISAVYVQFFTGPSYGSQIGSPLSGGLTLDISPNTWQTASLSGAIPAGTRWLLSQVLYNDASLMGIDGLSHPGYVDAANLTITPEPAGLGVLALTALALWKRWR
ncbi:MAG TPA: hypothetical protein VMV94_12900 [Phycisphaerae bacterium]|nr:hypothetical protein [Phycisphaerae bacterium]